MIDGAQPSNDLQGEDAIINAMQSSGLDSERLDNGNSKVGQIIVELRRVRLGTMRPNEKHPTKHREARNDDVDMDGQDITHTTEYFHAQRTYSVHTDLGKQICSQECPSRHTHSCGEAFAVQAR